MRRLPGLVTRVLLVLCMASLLSIKCSGQASMSQAPAADLERVLKEALKKRQGYVETFKNLTADETKVTEIFDDSGKLKSQRKQLAYFLVYQSERDEQVINEYRIVREVDGKPVKNAIERAQNLFKDLARAKTLEAEWKRLREENLRYTFKYYRWDATLHPAFQLEEKDWPAYEYEIAPGQKLDGRETLILSYKKKSLVPASQGRILSDFKDPMIGNRGRLWLDSETFQLRRWENESIVRHLETGTLLVYLRDEVEYAQSELGIMVPKRIVVSFLNKLSYKAKDNQPPRTLMGGRITYTYDGFKRFEVTSRQRIDSIK